MPVTMDDSGGGGRGCGSDEKSAVVGYGDMLMCKLVTDNGLYVADKL